jgi:hypothetical protein
MTPHLDLHMLTLHKQGETENRVLAYAAAHGIEAAAARPGLMFRAGSWATRAALAVAPSLIVGYVDVVVAAMLCQVVGGFESDTLTHADLVRLAKEPEAGAEVSAGASQ